MTFGVSCTSPRELGKCPSVSETENILANSHLLLCHHIGTSSIICRVFVQSERAFSVGRYQESDCRVEGQMWILLRVRLGRPGPASRGPRLSLSRNTCTCMHAYVDVPAAELSMPYALRFPRFVCLIFTYLFILPAPSLYFTSFSTFLLVRSQTRFGSGPTSARKQHHTALAGVFQVFRG